MSILLNNDLIHTVASQLAIDWRGLHGLSHWARVQANGLRLAEQTGADRQVVALFALFHDSRRFSDQADPEHGPRGAQLAEALRESLPVLSATRYIQVMTACQLHTISKSHHDITVQTCFDADRLDLGRLGTIVDPAFLCTKAACDPLCQQWATAQSKALIIPDNEIGQYLQARLRSAGDL